MRAYFSLFRIRIIRGLQYRTAALAGVFTQFFWGFMYIMIFEAFYKSTLVVQPISLVQLVQVVWLQQAFLMLIMLWIKDADLIALITSGNIAYELCRPIDLYYFWYAKLIAYRLSATLLRCFPILIVAFLLPSPYNFVPPSSVLVFFLFLITLFLGLIIIVAISMFVYISTFFTISPAGTILIFGVFGEFLAGLIIPVPLMPTVLKTIVYMLPFRYASDLPFRIYAGNIGIQEALISILVQIFWIVTIVSAGKIFMKRSLRKVVVQGG
jgi:ABC-2 type transport system permease protein